MTPTMTDEIKEVKSKTLPERGKRTSKPGKQIRFVDKKATPAESIKSSLATSYFATESSSESESGLSSGSSYQSFRVIAQEESKHMTHLSSLMETNPSKKDTNSALKIPERNTTGLHLAIAKASAELEKALKKKKPKNVFFDIKQSNEVPKITFNAKRSQPLSRLATSLMKNTNAKYAEKSFYGPIEVEEFKRDIAKR